MIKAKQFIPMYKHQIDTVLANENIDYFAMLYDVGAGKTPATINIIREKFFQHKRFLKTLIIAPLSVIFQWKTEWVKFGGPMYEKEVVVAYGSSHEKIELLKSKANIFITNIDSVNNKKILAVLLSMGFEIIVCDESHIIKNIKSQRYKNIIKIGVQTKYRYIMTGTPQTNGIEDLWAQYNFLCPGVVFHENFYVFRAMYFYDANARLKFKMGPKYFPNYVFRKELLPEIMKKIATCSHVVKKEDCIDLPELIRTERYVELTPEQKRIYKEMEEDYIATLGENNCVAPIAMVKSIRLQQIICGIFTDDFKHNHRIPNNRPALLKEILEGLPIDSKKIIWTNFIETYDDIAKVCKDLGINYVLLTGQQKPNEKEENKTKFKTDPTCTVLIANPASGGTGLNLQEAGYSIYYSRTFNLEHDLQSEARNYRSGSIDFHTKVTRIDIVAKNTIDITVLRALREKKDLHEALRNFKGGKNENTL